MNKSLVVLAILGLSMPVLAETIRGSKSNGSFRGTCSTAACCKQYPGSAGCNGSVLKIKRSPRGTGAQPSQPVATTTTVNASKSNSFREVAPQSSVIVTCASMRCKPPAVCVQPNPKRSGFCQSAAGTLPINQPGCDRGHNDCCASTVELAGCSAN